MRMPPVYKEGVITIFFKVGRWSYEKSSNMKCLSSCNRQENHVETSYYKFPNRMFLRSEEVIKLVKKLGTMCNSGKPRRALLNTQYPEICPFFDEISQEDLAADVNNSFTVHQFFTSLNMTSDDLRKFKEQLLAYASDNLVKINAFFDSPYLSKYQTDEVFI